MESNVCYSYIHSIAYELPKDTLSNEELTKLYPEWTTEKIFKKTGIANRRVVDQDSCVSDLAVAAAERLFSQGSCSPKDIEFILLCTQSPDYILPTTACIIQDRLGCDNSVGALDFNLGCSGYVYGLSLAKGLIESHQVKNVLLITAETYSKFLHPDDKSVRSIFGDGATATLIKSTIDPEFKGGVSCPLLGTDGSGAKHLMVERGLKNPTQVADPYLRMNGSEILVFTLKHVPKLVQETLDAHSMSHEDIDLFVFHQANAFMLETLRKKINIPHEKFFLHLENVGNTVSSTIPIAIKEASNAGKLKNAKKVMLVGFGVGLSWGSVIVDLSLFK